MPCLGVCLKCAHVSTHAGTNCCQGADAKVVTVCVESESVASRSVRMTVCAFACAFVLPTCARAHLCLPTCARALVLPTFQV
eukprot:7928432-Alexandrium_andersonii.AAC.1